MRCTTLLRVLLGVSVAAGITRAEPLPRYSVVNAAFPDRFCHTYSLNDAGQAAGVYAAGASQWHAYIFDPAAGIHDLSELDAAGFTNHTTCAINNAGSVAVSGSGISGSLLVSRAVVFDGVSVVAVPPVSGTYTDAAAINSAGHVAGRTDTPPSAVHAYLYDGAGVQDLGQIDPPFGSSFRATGVNDLDHVVGVGDNASGRLTGFLWDGTMHNLGDFQPSAINDAGIICGRVPAGLFFRAAVRTPEGTVRTLPTLGGRNSGAAGVNQAGDMVGYSQLPDGSSAAVLWPASGGVVNLNDFITRGAAAEGWQVTAAYAINGPGQILGFSGYYPLLLTLVDDCFADFNGDGGTDGADVDAFFSAWEAGDLTADVSADGGIDGADIELFFVAWAEGTC